MNFHWLQGVVHGCGVSIAWPAKCATLTNSPRRAAETRITLAFIIIAAAIYGCKICKLIYLIPCLIQVPDLSHACQMPEG